jgi:hypothetical protein
LPPIPEISPQLHVVALPATLNTEAFHRMGVGLVASDAEERRSIPPVSAVGSRPSSSQITVERAAARRPLATAARIATTAASTKTGANDVNASPIQPPTCGAIS